MAHRLTRRHLDETLPMRVPRMTTRPWMIAVISAAKEGLCSVNSTLINQLC